MDEKDLRVDTFTSGVQQPCLVRVTHLPTGKTAQATDVSRLRAEKQARNELREALAPRTD